MQYANQSKGKVNIMKYNRKIITEDGDEYYGYAFGDICDRVCEIVFNTSMAGYQEIISDPSYTYQAVVMSYPLIGNYGIADDDYETDVPTIGGLIVREYNDLPSNFRSKETLAEVMKRYNIPGIYGVDTRKLVRSIRDKGSRRVLLCNADMTKEEGVKLIENTPVPHDAVSRVSCKDVRKSPAEKPVCHIVDIDCGMKKNILRSINARGCDVTVVPWNTSAWEIERLAPDGVFISNGPGDPEDVTPTINTIKQLIGKFPIFGICLGHQIISLAYGAKTYKMKFGHRGGNHPVRNIATNKIEITSQNHSYAVENDSVKNTPLTVTHINLLDNTIEGVECVSDRVFSVQYHPESAPGPRDSFYLFDKFIDIIKGGEKNA